jgi:hypothetical protein
MILSLNGPSAFEIEVAETEDEGGSLTDSTFELSRTLALLEHSMPGELSSLEEFPDT